MSELKRSIIIKTILVFLLIGALLFFWAVGSGKIYIQADVGPTVRQGNGNFIENTIDGIQIVLTRISQDEPASPLESFIDKSVKTLPGQIAFVSTVVLILFALVFGAGVLKKKVQKG